MLSLVDLIDAGTVDVSLAAYLAAAMRSGASLLVGANPGGAGKTAVMCALLNFLPNHTSIRPVGSQHILVEGHADPNPGHTCYLAHEIGSGYYYAYVWGHDAREFFRLVTKGHIVAANLHADTLEETRDQLCRENGVDRKHLDAVTLKVYLRVERTNGWNVRRRVSHVYESDGTRDRLIWKSHKTGVFTRHDSLESAIVASEDERKYAEFLTRLLRDDVRRIEEVRRELLLMV